jgi:hypothetical protein
MSRLEQKFFGAGLSEKPCFQATMHKPVTMGVFSDADSDLVAHAGSWGIDQITDLNTVFSGDAPHISTCNISKPETMLQFSSLLANSD